jgi:hypothetical protein
VYFGLIPIILLVMEEQKLIQGQTGEQDMVKQIFLNGK